MSGSPRTVWNASMEARAKKLWRRGKTVTQIAITINVSRQTVHYHLSRWISEAGGESSSQTKGRKRRPSVVNTERSVVINVPNRSAVGSYGSTHVKVSVPRLKFMENTVQ